MKVDKWGVALRGLRAEIGNTRTVDWVEEGGLSQEERLEEYFKAIAWHIRLADAGQGRPNGVEDLFRLLEQNGEFGFGFAWIFLTHTFDQQAGKEGLTGGRGLKIVSADLMRKVNFLFEKFLLTSCDDQALVALSELGGRVLTSMTYIDEQTFLRWVDIIFVQRSGDFGDPKLLEQLRQLREQVLDKISRRPVGTIKM